MISSLFISENLLFALISGFAYKKNLKSALGKTTVPMSLPSITVDRFSENSLRCLYTCSRTVFSLAKSLTISEIPIDLISFETSSSFK